MRFLHTSDWQLGLHRYYLDPDAQARYADDRHEAIRRLGEVAREEDAAFAVVAGDVFDSNRVDRRTLLRALDAMADVPVPLYLLPGNHDPLDAASVYRSRPFLDHRPEGVTVIGGSEPLRPAPGVEVVGAPWRSKRPSADPLAGLAAGLAPAPAGTLRVAVAHGAVSTLAPDPDDPAVISTVAAEEALAAGLFHYLALGDRHSATRVAERIHYSGTPEVTDFDEERPGRVLVVELDGDACRVEERQVGRWSFLPLEVQLAGEADLERLAAELEAVEAKSRTVVRLRLSGQLPLHARVDLDNLLADARQRFAAVDDHTPDGSPALIPDDLDRSTLDLGGVAAAAFEALLAEAGAGDAREPTAETAAGERAGDDGEGEAETGAAGAAGEDPGTEPAVAPPGDDAEARRAVARDALALLYRLAGETAP